ncbi:hypothetical protein G647_07391 [Cladophialophora carrionii CBS 160.54]|uniref:Heterokaryon incompatibility domain-containing protein n=1 Tax=Cladophialophora carrionii CBS 160.54 TaxID=1279043 RepID=V9D435_9EURO|nr:uncharacterized protein G647_07391 [Cladophialophora carrionii CBS 160.54]ETI21048.1 hypothetical protein G647_07391 [Cladophialophora carrionii CBS 160.54]
MEELWKSVALENAPEKQSNSMPPTTPRMSFAHFGEPEIEKTIRSGAKRQVSVCGEAIPSARDQPSVAQIRRLRLIGADNRDNPLRGVIETVPSSACNPYTAVSYVWGDKSQPFRLLVGEGQYIPLTTSLDSMPQDFQESLAKSEKRAGRWVVVT